MAPFFFNNVDDKERAGIVVASNSERLEAEYDYRNLSLRIEKALGKHTMIHKSTLLI